MKTAVSIPDRIFEAAERVAKRKGITRSELYARALAELLRTQDDAEITAQLDRVYGAEDGGLDRELATLPARVVEREQW
jgi:metal-responsive CopG/Arc/MetJ family transcriptional regulator